MSQRTVHVVLTTHWDREWVQSFEQYRFRLVNLMERLLAVLAAEPSLRFVFDGQTIVLEDYLAIRPEQTALLKQLGTSGRLVFGPWYVLADQFLEGDEATVRNLLIGREIAAAFGGAMREGYNPDSFGSIATMPMILNGFGITTSNLGRGVRSRPHPLHVFRWSWRDGSEVLALDVGYGNGMGLTWNRVWNNIAWNTPPTDTALTAGELLLTAESERYPAAHLYASVGMDHLETRPGLEGQLAALSAHTPQARWISSTPADFLAASARELAQSHATLDHLVGEMRGDLTAPMHLQGVLSTDTPLKSRNRHCEIVLGRVLEPLEVLCRLAGGTSQRHVLRRAWRLLVAGHPHDSICACSTDATMQDIHARLRQVEELATISSERWLRELVGRRPHQPGDEVSLMLFNGLPGRGRDQVTRLFRIPARLSGERYLVRDQAQAVVGVLDVLGLRAIDIETFYATDADLLRVRSKVPAADNPEVYTVVRLQATVDFGISSGIVVLGVDAIPVTEVPADPALRATATSLDNGIVALAVAADGCLTLTDRRSGRSFAGLGFFEDMADIGDSYDYNAVAHDVPLRSHEAATVTSRVFGNNGQVATLAVETRWHIPARLADGISRRERRAPSFRWPTPDAGARSGTLVELHLVSEYTLHAGAQRVEVRTRFVNPADHHRLRVAFASSDRPALVSGGHFAALERPWSDAQDGFPCRPLLDWIHRGDGLGILVRGLFEWEPRQVGAGGEILVTMIRSTDTIGPAAGANYDIENARALGSHAIEYALVPSASAAQTARHALAYTTPVLADGVVHAPGTQPWATLPLRLLAIADERLLFSACKRSEDDGGVVVRCWNPEPQAVRSSVASACGSHGYAVRLDETAVSPDTVMTAVQLSAPGFGTGSVLIPDRQS